MKRLKNVEGKNEQQLEAIKDQGENQLDAIKNYGSKKESFKKLEFPDEKQQEINKLVDELRQINKKLENDKKDGNLLCVHTNGREYNYNKFTLLEQFYYDILSGKVTIRQTKDEQNEINKEISDLEKYNPAI